MEENKTKDIVNITDPVDLSNACREFYQSRRKTAETVKERLAASGRQQKLKTTSLDTAMSKLRTEMVWYGFVLSWGLLVFFLIKILFTQTLKKLFLKPPSPLSPRPPPAIYQWNLGLSEYQLIFIGTLFFIWNSNYLWNWCSNCLKRLLVCGQIKGSSDFIFFKSGTW